MSATAASPGAATAEPSGRLNRTCQACRERKIKCTLAAQSPGPDGASKPATCTRCRKLSIDCIFALANRTKTRRRNEGRIKSLEQRLAAIQATVSTAIQAETLRAGPSTSPSSVEHAHSLSANPSTSNKTTPWIASGGTSDDGSGDPFAIDCLGAGLVEELFSAFRNQLAPLYPIVLLPSALTWQFVQRDRPALFRAILTAASSKVYPSISTRLFRETGRYLAEKVMVVGDKSLDLVQALLILSTWHLPPDTFVELKFSQYAHMAATMVMDLRSSNDVRYAVPAADQLLAPSAELVEVCRTFAANYFLCSSMAMSFRRPTSLSYGPWVESCLRVLEYSAETEADDRRLVEWVKLQRIAEESLSAIGLDGESPVDFPDPRTKLILKACVEKVVRWRRTIPIPVMNETLEIHYRMILICLHEPALHDSHNLGDFRPPYTLRRLPLSKMTRAEPTRPGDCSLSQCIAVAQDLVDSFLKLPAEVLLSMPVVTYTRMAYAVIILIKCYVSAGTTTFAYNQYMDPTRTISDLLQKLASVQDETQGPFQVPAVFHSVLSAVSLWIAETFAQGPHRDGEDIMEPLMHFTVKDRKDGEDGPRPYSIADSHLLGPGGQVALSPTTSGWLDSASLGDAWFDASAMGSLLDLPDFLDPSIVQQDNDIMFS